jgi:hypothetical protein
MERAMNYAAQIAGAEKAVAGSSGADDQEQLEDYYDSMVDFNLYDADDAGAPVGVEVADEVSSSADSDVDESNELPTPDVEEDGHGDTQDDSNGEGLEKQKKQQQPRRKKSS